MKRKIEPRLSESVRLFSMSRNYPILVYSEWHVALTPAFQYLERAGLRAYLRGLPLGMH